MNLLYKHFTNIPENEELSAVFIIDGNLSYVATKRKDRDNEYKLYTTSKSKIKNLQGKSDMISKFDSIITKRLSHVIEQSAVFDNEGIRVVKYKTYRQEVQHKPSNNVEIKRYIGNKTNKLF